nr:MAG: putative viral replication protein [Circoviridae sp.]
MFMVNAQTTNWCFTINNPTPLDYTTLHELGGTVKYLIFSDETGVEGTPHIQGFVVFSSRLRLRSARLHLPRAHLEAARGTCAQASEYCRKEGSTNTHIYGQLPNVPGKTNLYESFRDWVLEQPCKPTPALVAYKYPSLFLRNGRTQTFIDAIYPVAAPVVAVFRPYQQALAEDLDGAPDPRKIYFVVDPVGNSGKSWFAHNYFRSNPSNVQILSAGKRDDIAYAIDDVKSIFLFDLPRSTSEFLQYSILEQLKNGLIFSNKYESRMKCLGGLAHVVVFMNEYPDMTKLSSDRYKILVWNHES